ncbi:MAG: efflux RND transporter periplasmic adaptor subunit [Betaproteobacteria bacterium]
MRQAHLWRLAALAAVCALSFAAPAQDKAAAVRPALTVSAVQPQTLILPQVLQAHGSVAAWQEALVGAELPGLKLTEVRVNVGDVVRRGDVLALLQSDTMRAEMAQTQAALAESEAAAQESRAQAERSRALQQQGFISPAQLSSALASEAVAQARVQSARAALGLQQLRLAQTEVRAPDAGVISGRTATVGSGAGAELFRLIRQGRLEWRAEVTAAELPRVRVGAPVRLQTAAGLELQGRVRMLAPSADPQTRNALVYVDVSAPRGQAAALVPGMFASGQIELGRSPGLTVPQTAVVVRDGFSYVYALGAQDKVAQVKVQTGRQVGDRLEIVSGLAPDARLVASGGAFLNHGDTVRVMPVATPAAAPVAAPASK